MLLLASIGPKTVAPASLARLQCRNSIKDQEEVLVDKAKESSTVNAVIDSPGVLTFLPVLYVAWADGLLTSEEIGLVRALMTKQDWLSGDEKVELSRWLDPGSPPSAELLQVWLMTIKNFAPRLPDSARVSLAELGRQVAKLGATTEAKKLTGTVARAALDEIEEALGVLGAEAAQEILEGDSRPSVVPPIEAASFDVERMTEVLTGDESDLKKDVLQLLSTRPFAYFDRPGDTEGYREQVLSWVRILAEKGYGILSYPESVGGENSLAKSIAVFQTLAFHDLSLTVKFGVQFGLFGGSVLQLGTEKHHRKYLAQIGNLSLPGCFAMTELGHGSNVRDIETTARFDRAAAAFVIHSPHESARKEYIGNAARHGRMATVFAQLIIDEVPYGVHAFLVPIRDASGKKLPGVEITDCGHKIGLNGVDNGTLKFNEVSVPLDNLLNRFADVNTQGEYSSSIPGASKRFFTMLGTLIGGRISISAAALSAAKSGLAISIRYAGRRRQFGQPGDAETLLLDYPSHQRRLFPRLATAYGLNFAIAHLTRRYTESTEEDAREVEVLAAAIKAFSTWNTTATLQDCREACGGAGYLSENRLGILKADSEIFTTFEGDNTVLMQLVAKGLLTEFKHQFEEMKFFGIVKYVAEKAAMAIAERNPIVTRMTDPAHLRDPDFQKAVFRHREEDLTVSVARRIKKKIDSGMDSYEAFIACQNHLINLGQAYAERVVLEQFYEGIEASGDEMLIPVLKRVATLFAFSHIEKHKGWYLEHGYLEAVKTKAMRREFRKICMSLQPDAIALVDAFGIPEACLAAPIGTNA